MRLGDSQKRDLESQINPRQKRQKQRLSSAKKERGWDPS